MHVETTVFADRFRRSQAPREIEELLSLQHALFVNLPNELKGWGPEYFSGAQWRFSAIEHCMILIQVHHQDKFSRGDFRSLLLDL